MSIAESPGGCESRNVELADQGVLDVDGSRRQAGLGVDRHLQTVAGLSTVCRLLSRRDVCAVSGVVGGRVEGAVRASERVVPPAV